MNDEMIEDIESTSHKLYHLINPYVQSMTRDQLIVYLKEHKLVDALLVFHDQWVIAYPDDPEWLDPDIPY
jgi:hypothetical protein